MRSPLRLFLITRKRGFDWKIFVSQSLEDTHTEWMKQSELGDVTGVLHVGFGRPATRIFNQVAESFDGRLLATQGARYVLPPPSLFSKGSVGVAEKIPLYLLLDGWGYSAHDPTIGADQKSAGSSLSSQKGNSAEAPSPTGWVAQFMSIAPDFKAAVEQANIHDEVSYLENERKLPGTIRTALGQFRFDHLISDSSDAIEIVRASPPWLLDQELENLPITVRLRNVFSVCGIKIVSDLQNFSRDRLFATKNFGRRSYADLFEALQEGLRRGAIDFSGDSVASELSRKDLTSGAHDFSEPTPSSPTVSLGLLGNLLKTLNEMNERERDILFGRMGFNAPPRTLEDLGNEYSVTRERIRQLEKRSLDRLIKKEIWDDAMLHRLGSILDSRDEPVPLFGLEVLDDWFRGTSEKQDALAYLIENICEQRFNILKIGSFRYVSRIDQETWNEKLKDARRLLESAIDLNWSEDECRHAVSTFLQGRGKELVPLLWSEASKLCHFTGSPGERILTAYGRGVDQLVQVVLEESQHPLHTSEVAQMVGDLAGREISEGQVRNSVANVGLLLGRGTYGLRKHIPLSDSEIDEVVQFAFDVMSNETVGRQWHASELVLEIRELVGEDFGERLEKYEVNAALQLKSDLRYLGRLVWALPDAENGQRFDLRDAIIDILEHAGRPLTGQEINQRLLEFRGVNGTVQIWSRDPVLRVGRGLWGLNDRDLAVKREHQAGLIDEVFRALRKKGSGIHLEEIKDYIDCDGSIDPEEIFSIAALDERIAIGVGRFAYLREWGDPRRMTLNAALNRLIEQVPGPMMISDIHEWIEFMTERKYEKRTITHALSSSGAIYLGDGAWEIKQQELEFDRDNSDVDRREL